MSVSARWGRYLAHPVYEPQSRIHDPAALRLTLSLYASRRGPQCPLGHPWRIEFRAVRGVVSHFADGALSPDLYARPTQSGDNPDTLWTAATCLFPRSLSEN